MKTHSLFGLAAAMMVCVSCDRSPVSWSPDGKRFAFTAWALHPKEAFVDEAAICVHDIKSNKTTILHRTKNSVLSAPSFSPDGRTIAFLEEGDFAEGKTQIHYRIVSADAGDGPKTVESSVRFQSPWPRRVMMPELPGCAPIWMTESVFLVPDGHPAKGQYDVVALDQKAGARRFVAKTADWPVLSPDGKRLLLCDPETRALRIMNLADRTLEWVPGIDPSESRLGRKNYGPFNRAGHLCTGLAWSPDGTSILGVRDQRPSPEQNDDIVGLNLSSGAIATLYTENRPRTVAGFAASSSGKQLAVVRKDWPKGLTQLSIRRLDDRDGKARVASLQGVGSSGAHVSWSPDGRYLVIRTSAPPDTAAAKTRFELFDSDGNHVRSVEAPTLRAEP
ncbi:MAG: TolB family protein [Planctomycetota bacterium]|jgi:Tol biopolymer transport system component